MITIKNDRSTNKIIPMDKMEIGDTGIVVSEGPGSEGALFLKAAKGFISLNNPAFDDVTSFCSFDPKNLEVRLVDIDIIVKERL